MWSRDTKKLDTAPFMGGLVVRCKSGIRTQEPAIHHLHGPKPDLREAEDGTLEGKEHL
jgi:hypothetical protein